MSVTALFEDTPPLERKYSSRLDEVLRYGLTASKAVELAGTKAGDEATAKAQTLLSEFGNYHLLSGAVLLVEPTTDDDGIDRIDLEHLEGNRFVPGEDLIGDNVLVCRELDVYPDGTMYGYLASDRFTRVRLQTTDPEHPNWSIVKASSLPAEMLANGGSFSTEQLAA